VGDLLVLLRREDERPTGVVVGERDLPEELALLRVECRRRLVQREQLWRAEEGDREAEALAVPDGERAPVRRLPSGSPKRASAAPAASVGSASPWSRAKSSRFSRGVSRA
jgi:hypothetical protein